MLKITIVSSDEDIASKTIRSQLLKKYNFQKIDKGEEWNSEHVLELFSFKPEGLENSLEFILVRINLRMIHLEDHLRREDLHGDLVFFASRHRSEAGKQALLCHTPGNWNEHNDYGGAKNSIARGSGLVLHYMFKYLSQELQRKPIPFAIDQEVTHHGPTEFDQPLAFIELGSDIQGWKNVEAGEIVADVIIHTGISLLKNHYKKGKLEKAGIKVCVGFCGPHYMANFTKLVDFHCGFVHTVPKYQVSNLNKEMVAQIQDKSMEKIDYWVVDWKGLNSNQKTHLFAIFEELGIEYIRRRDLERELTEKMEK